VAAPGFSLVDPLTGKSTSIEIPKGIDREQPAWSPDGKQLAYIANFDAAIACVRGRYRHDQVGAGDRRQSRRSSDTREHVELDRRRQEHHRRRRAGWARRGAEGAGNRHGRACVSGSIP